MRLRSFGLLFGLLAGLAACSDADDDIRKDVTLLVNHEGATAMAAADHLARYGRRAIPMIEGAMHTAAPPGRKNLILALRKVGDPEAVPLLGHIAAVDQSPDVRREAEWTLRQWAADGSKPERAAKSKQAVRTLEEARGSEEAG
jgi:hypothetical protein